MGEGRIVGGWFGLSSSHFRDRQLPALCRHCGEGGTDAGDRAGAVTGAGNAAASEKCDAAP
jgi:hypothetical protein